MDAVATSPSSDDTNYQPPAGRSGLSRLRLAMASLWTVVIMMLCWIPGSVVREFEHGSSWFKVPDLDKMIHAGIFVVFSVLWHVRSHPGVGSLGSPWAVRLRHSHGVRAENTRAES